MGAEGVTLQQFPSRALAAYTQVEFARLERKRAVFNALPLAERQLLPEYEQRISAMKQCVQVNANLLARMAESIDGITPTTSTSTSTSTNSNSNNNSTNGNSAGNIATMSSMPDQASSSSTGPVPPPLLGVAGDPGTDDTNEDICKKVRRGLSNLALEWGDTGREERARIYAPIVASVGEAYGEKVKALRALKREHFRVLVTGANNGRLAWELVNEGYFVEGCEESFIELVIGNFIINHTNQSEEHVFYPYIHEYSNNKAAANVVQAVSVPDVNPKKVAGSSNMFSMRAASFVNTYDGQDNAWDVVVSYKAFDINETLVDHTRRVGQILKPGGVWVVIGPVPCVEGAQGDGVHISAEEFIELVRRCGFKIIKNESMTCLHSTDQDSLRTVYTQSPFIVAVKVRPLA